jgi:DNA-binding transcriptional MerR regulator
MDDRQLWKIGRLAQLTGLTVRALHHYDHVGLVRPSGRTGSGHRLYTADDVERLYRALALRVLGLPLAEIRTVLDGGQPIAAVLEQHLGLVERQLVALRTLRARLATMVEAAAVEPGPTGTDLLSLINEVTTVDETVKNYFSDEQLAELAERRQALGEGRIADVQARWPQLITEVQDAVDAGLAPDSPTGLGLARQWTELLEAFHGGDPQLRDSLFRMQAENSGQIEQQFGGPTPEQLQFIQQATSAGADRVEEG